MSYQQSHPSDWSDFPAPLLQTALQSQLNALDNCAAACTCRAWRAAVSNAPVAHLHLHVRLETHIGNHEAVLAKRISQWSSFLASRRSVGHLKLTTDTDLNFVRQTQFKETMKTALKLIVRSSTSLTVSHRIFDMLHQVCTVDLAALQQLSVISNVRHKGTLPDLSSCSNLKMVQLTSWNEECLRTAENFPPKFPGGLQTLCIQVAAHMFGRPDYWYIASWLTDQLPNLRCLELWYCSLSFSAESLQAFSCLDSLSLAGSQVDSQGDIRMLTNLKMLDLRACSWRSRGYASDPAWTRFQAWPALQLLNFTGFNLIDKSTMLEVASLSEVHTDFMVACLERAKVHLSDAICLEALSSASFMHFSWCTCLVELQLNVESGTASQLLSLVSQLLGPCALRILGVTAYAQDHDGDKQPLHLVCTAASKLRKLKLQGISCECIDLSMSSIVEVVLRDMNLIACPSMPLPTTLESLDLGGCSWLQPSSPMCLQYLTALSHVTLRHSTWMCSAGDTRQHDQMILPTFPAGLHTLRILDSEMWNLVDTQFRTCLRFCSSLQHLTLPPNTILPHSRISTWTKKARVHVVDSWSQ